MLPITNTDVILISLATSVKDAVEVVLRFTLGFKVCFCVFFYLASTKLLQMEQMKRQYCVPYFSLNKCKVVANVANEKAFFFVCFT